MNLARRLVASLLALAAARASADDSNFRPYILGGRAGGMGGAFTALADDGSGPYYNPGGLAFVEKSQLSLSASVYGLVSGSQEAALGAGHDLNYSNLNVFPVSTTSIFKFGDPEAPGVTAPNALALSVFVPDGLLIDTKTSLTPGVSQNAVFYRQEVQTIWAGPTYARRIGRVGLGAGAFVLFGKSSLSTDLTAILDPANFAVLSVRMDTTTVGLVGAVGARWDATDHLRLGLAFYTPELGLYGARSEFVRAGVAAPTQSPANPSQIAVANSDDLHASPSLPYRVQLGLAWTQGPFTIAGDAIVLGARDVVDDAGTPFEWHVKRNLVVNGSLGAEWLITPAVPLRAGVFTDFAASPVPVEANPTNGSSNVSNVIHVNRWGGTVSIGYQTEHTATDLGLQLSHGTGTALQIKDFDFTSFVPKSASETLTYVFLSTAYRF